MNYRKSILSLAAVLALSSSVTADPNAAYVPLTNKEFDKAWIMFGVNDFSTGIPTPAASDSDFSTGYSVVQEVSTSDDLVSPSPAIVTTNAANTTFVASDGIHNMATYQALKDASGAALITETLNMALKTTDVVYSEQQPVRSMYIAIQKSATDTNTVAKIKLNYRASLEGRTIEIQLNNTGTVYKTNVSERATFNNPAIAKELINTDPELDEMAPEDVLAYDLTASPVLASAYSKIKHQGASRGAERFYHYDAANAQWILWDRAKVADGTNTLTKFKRGNAYWGRMDINSNGTTVSDTRAGLYLGKSGRDEADPTIYTNDLVPDSWNMVGFDPATHPDIRNAATGLVVTLDADFAANDAIVLLDETGTNSVTVDFNETKSGYVAAKYINAVIESDKIAGKIPDTFNIKSFIGDANTTMIFLSDKQFSIKDDAANPNLAGVVTIANNSDVIISDGTKANVADINETGVTSVYGEYAMIIEPLVGADTASNLDGVLGASAAGDSVASAAVVFGNIDDDSANGPVPFANDDTNTTMATAQAKLTADDIFDGSVTASDNTVQTGQVILIDTNFDGTASMLLAAANKSFYIKDNTFTRVYSVDTGTDGLGGALAPFAITPYTSPNITATPAAATVAAVETAINNSADTNATDNNSTGIYADIDPDDATKLIIVTKDSKVLELLDVDSATTDYFSAASSTSDIAKGAVKRVINIAELARERVVTNRFTFTFGSDGDGDKNVSIAVNSLSGVDVNNTSGNDTDRLVMLDALVAATNTVLKDNNISAFASHNYLDTTDDITKAILSVEGIGILTATSNINGSASLTITDDGEKNTNPGTLNVDGAVIIADLKANAVYTPDYVNYGPLYTLKSASYEAKAIIRPSTQLASSPTTHWDHIDLTRDSKDWLKNNEYNLFNVGNSAGYWVFIDAYAAQNDIAESNLVWTPSFAHHFNTKTGATENLLNAATFSVEIADGSAVGGVLDEETSNAKLIISANEVQLTKTGSTFTAVLTEPETTGLTPNTGPLSITLHAADGLGESYVKSDLISFDYDKPDAPVVNFNNGIDLSFTSADATSFYLWQDYVPDDGNSNTPKESQLLVADAGAYNICKLTNYLDTTSYQVVAFDGTGVFGKSNASDITGFTYVNTLKGATVLTHSQGDDTSAVVSYDSVTCVADATPLKSGVEAKAVQPGTIVLSYIALEGTVATKDDLPFSAFYEIDNGGADVLQVDTLKAYASKVFYIEYNGALYKGIFPADQTAADASFSDAIDLTAVTSKNQSLD